MSRSISRSVSANVHGGQITLKTTKGEEGKTTAAVSLA